MMNPVLSVRVQFLGDGPNKQDRQAVVDAIHARTNQDVCAVIASEWEPTEADIAQRVLAKLIGGRQLKYIALGAGKLDLNVSGVKLEGDEEMLVSRMMKR